MSEYLAVRTSAYWANLFHAALPESRHADGTYRSICGLRRPMQRYLRHNSRDGFYDTDEAFRCRKCIVAIERLENPPPPQVIAAEREAKRAVIREQRKRWMSARTAYVRRRVTDPVKIDELFEMKRFMDDVNAYRRRHGMTWADIAIAARITGSVSGYGTNPSLRIVLALADVCDLSVDTYRIERIR